MVIPAWIQQQKEQMDLNDARREAEEQRRLVANLAIHREGPVFWKRFINALNTNVTALSAIRLAGTITVTGDIEAEACCNIVVVRQGAAPGRASIDFFYSRKAHNMIRCSKGDDFGILLQAYGERVMAMDIELMPMEPECLADKQIKELADTVRAA